MSSIYTLLGDEISESRNGKHYVFARSAVSLAIKGSVLINLGLFAAKGPRPGARVRTQTLACAEADWRRCVRHVRKRTQ